MAGAVELRQLPDPRPAPPPSMLSASRRGKFFWNKHRELRLDGPEATEDARGRERERLARPAPGGHAWGSSRPSRGLALT